MDRSLGSSEEALHVLSPSGTSRWLPSLWDDRRAVVCFLRQLGCRFCRQQIAAMAKIAPQLAAATPPIALIFISLGSPTMASEYVERFGCPGELYVDPSTRGRVSVNVALGDAAKSQTYAQFRLLRGREAVSNDSTAAVAQAALDAFGDTPSLSDADHRIVENAGLRPRRRSRALSGLDDMEMPSASAADGDAEDDEDDEKEIEWAGDPFQVGGVFVLGPGNGCLYSFRSRYAGHHPPLDVVLAAATGAESDGTPVVYPSAQGWADRLDVLKVLQLPALPDISVDIDVKTRVGRANRFAVAMGCVIVALAFIAIETLALPGSVEKKIAVLCTALSAMLGFAWLHCRNSSSRSGGGKLATTSLANADAGAAPPPLDGPAGEGEQVLSDNAAFRLFTPREVDRTALDRGLLECDCDATVAAIPLVGIARLRTASIGEAKVGSDLVLSSEEECPLLALALAEESSALNSADVPTYLEICCYLRYFLALPHPALGRPGPVCPFVPTALAKDVLYLSVVRTQRGADADSIKALARRFLSIFPSLAPTKGRLQQWKAVILIFPDIADADAPRLIDAVQQDVKGEFVEQGLMIGEFHKFNNSPGLRR